ncbi:DUF2723 domain-containing protein [uncultured Alistipes sp.]|uniref:glycosyltransferase family 117 protein n=1 Tax=uncultured Alistipes sp. TaxID=538949 RepID=UPI002620E5DA|nr:DUF2723 domain-containing protein [uncultured Alistipes sp.]
MTFFKRWNNITGWVVFAIAAMVYLMTMEPVSSLWDCSEFIATSYKLEVGHPPGAPLFMMLARLATLFAFGNPDYVGIAVNAMNSLASAFCILFLFWTITHLARRMMTRHGEEPTHVQTWAALGAGAVGALAYTFTDTFWFSAIEGEVYALSSMFTALVVWLMLKWEEQADQPHASRWIVLIAYLMGLSIGVHILNLLTIPTLAFIYYFRTTEKVTFKGVVYTTLIACAVLLFINNIIIPYTVWLGAQVDTLFVNTFGLPANSGMVVFALVLILGLGWAAWTAHRKGRVLLNILLLSTTMILVGFSSYASMTIRAAVNPPMNSNNPNNPHALLAVLNRDQYGSRPLLYGPYYSAPPESLVEKEITYLDENGRYKKVKVPSHYTHAPEFMHLFPRIWDSNKGERAYKQWAAYRTSVEVARDENGEVVRDEQGRPVRQEVLDFGRKRVYTDSYGDTRTVVEPTFAENLYFFFNYQLSYMYWRYFLWNFVGRQSDIQPVSSTIADGNWLSGIRWIDEKYVGPQDGLPREVAENKGRNTYYFLPFLLGLIGLLYQLNRDPRNFSIVMWLFIMTGIALVFYFNTSPGEPRERDYVYAGSFYAFSIWIGFGVLALRELFARIARRDNTAVTAAATVVGLCVPAILAAQNWDDHDRSGRYMARDIGWNYLQSTLPNSIIINYGDNDTFPLWNNQEVYGVRPDVRIMNTSYLGGEWYIDEMKTRANEAPGVPFSLPKSKYTYTNDYVPIIEAVDRATDIREVIDFIRSEDPRSKTALVDGSLTDYIPCRRIALPVNKENAIASGIVAEKDRDLMVDTVYLNLKGSALAKNELMLLDMLANFDWKRPIYLTQVYILQNLGLMDYLQFDGYAYRLVPILTPVRSAYEIGRVDPDYAAPLLRDTFRYGNLADPKVYCDYFIQYNLAASHAREAFARVAKELLVQGRVEEGVELLDLGLEKLPTSQIRFTDANTYPFLEAYYAASAMGVPEAAEKGDALLREYARTLIEYIEYYFRFEGLQGDMISNELDAKLDELGNVYYLASYAGRREIVAELNDYYRTLGVPEEHLLDAGTTPADSTQAAAVQ